jgi:hypothetical protein
MQPQPPQQQPMPPLLPQQTPNVPQTTTTEEVAEATQLPDLAEPYRGWYPRWWLLSALTCGALIGGLELASKFVCTGGEAEQTLLCQFETWTDPGRQTLIIGVVWLLFLLLWFPAHIFGVSYIEIYKKRGPIANTFAVISEFGPIYILILIYGTLAFCYIVVIWYLGQYFNPIAFSLASLIIFVAISCFLYRQPPAQRRMSILGFAFMGAFCIAIMFAFKRIQIPILVTEIVAIVVCGVLFSRRQPPSTQLTPEERLAYAQSDLITPAGVWTSLLHSLRPNRQAVANNPNQTTQPQP